MSKISQYPVASALTGSESLVLVQSGTTKKAAVSTVLNMTNIWAPGLGLLPSASAAANTTALSDISTAVNVAGGGVLIIPPGTYQFNGKTDGTALCTFTNLNGLTILAAGAIFADQTNYTGTQNGILFTLSGCRNVQAWVKSSSVVNTTATGPRGLVGFQLQSGTTAYDIHLDQVGGQAGVKWYRASTDPDSDRSRGGVVRIKANGVYYPVNGQFSGDDTIVTVDAVACGRNFDFYGCSHLDIRVCSKNQFATSIIGAAEGVGTSNIKLDYYDRDSTTGSGVSAPVLTIGFQNQTAVTISDLDLHFNIKNAAGPLFGATLAFDKLDNSLVADTVGRGHKLLNLTVSGISDQVSTTNHFTSVTAFTFNTTGTPDVVRNIRIKDFDMTGAGVNDSWINLLGTASVYQGRMLWENVNVGSGNLLVQNPSTMRVVTIGCTAATFQVNSKNTVFGDTGGVEVLLSTQTAANVAQIDFTGIDALFDEYLIRYWNAVPATDDSSFQFRASEDGGATFKAGATDYEYQSNISLDGGTNTVQSSTGAAQMQMTGSISNTAARGGASGSIRIIQPGGTTQDKQVIFDNIYVRSSALARGRVTGSGLFKLDTNAISAFRLMFSAGNITSGKFSLYGIRSS